MDRPGCANLFERTLDQGDVHPAVEFVGGVADRPDCLETKFCVQLESRAVVGGHGRDDRLVAQASGLRDELSEQCAPDALAVMDGIDVDQVLDDVDAALLPRKVWLTAQL